MALHLNLFHEVQKQQALRRRDPLKLSLYGLGAVALCFAGYYFLQLGKQSSLASENKRVQAEQSALAPKAEQAQKRADEISAMLTTSKKLVERMDGRLYWAPLLETLTQAVPAEIQLTRLAGDAQSEGSKRCTLSIDGIAAGAEPRQVAEEFRRSIAEKFDGSFKGATATFRTLEDSPEVVKLNGHNAPTATFSINIQFQYAPTEQSAEAQAPVAKKGA